MKTIDESLRIADGYNNNVKVNVAAPEHEAIVCLAAEVRRLRHQWQYYQDFCKQNGFDGITAMAVAVDKLREENERLRGWIRVEGGCNNTCTRQILGEVCPSCRCGKAVKDAARGGKITQEPAP